MHCSPRKAAAGAMIMPTRGNKPSRTRFKMGGGNLKPILPVTARSHRRTS